MCNRLYERFSYVVRPVKSLSESDQVWFVFVVCQSLRADLAPLDLDIVFFSEFHQFHVREWSVSLSECLVVSVYYFLKRGLFVLAEPFYHFEGIFRFGGEVRPAFPRSRFKRLLYFLLPLTLFRGLQSRVVLQDFGGDGLAFPNILDCTI